MRYRFYNRDAFWAVIAQAMIVLVFFPMGWVTWGLKEASSFALGGLICLLPNIYLYQRVFSYFGAHAAKRIVQAFYRGEIVKAVLTATGFIGALSLSWVSPPWLLMGFAATLGGFWLGPIILACLKVQEAKKCRIVGQ